MSLSKKRNLQDLSTDKNNKRLKNDSAIDLNFDVGQSNNQSANSSSGTAKTKFRRIDTYILFSLV